MKAIIKEWKAPGILYQRAGDVAILKVFGFSVFERVGNFYSLFGIAFRKP